MQVLEAALTKIALFLLGEETQAKNKNKTNKLHGNCVLQTFQIHSVSIPKTNTTSLLDTFVQHSKNATQFSARLDYSSSDFGPS